MAKQKKNSNYVTEKTTAAKAERDAAKIKEQNDKKVKTIAIVVAASVAFVALLIGILFIAGAFDYQPEGTYDASVTFDDGSSLHIELYGHDAPVTFEHFKKLCNEGHFNGRGAHTLLDGSLFFGIEVDGAKGIKGEFSKNGVDNKVPMKKGVICMARGDEYDSAYGQFFILTKNNSSLEGNYAAFGRITNLEALDKLLESIEVAEDGSVTSSPKITGISFHAAHH